MIFLALWLISLLLLALLIGFYWGRNKANEEYEQPDHACCLRALAHLQEPHREKVR